MEPTPEELIEIERRYGMKIGSRVRWTEAALEGQTNAQVLRKRRKDTVGVVLSFSVWGDPDPPTATIHFPERWAIKHPKRTKPNRNDIAELTKLRLAGDDTATTTPVEAGDHARD